MSFTSDLQIGDIFIGYRKGYWKVTSIQRRYLTARDVGPQSPYGADAKEGDEFNALIGMKQVADAKGVPKNGKKEYFCDAGYCQKISPESVQAEYEAAVKVAEDRRKVLLNILDQAV